MNECKHSMTHLNIRSLFHYAAILSLIFLFGQVGVFAQINEPIETNWEGVSATLLTC